MKGQLKRAIENGIQIRRTLKTNKGSHFTSQVLIHGTSVEAVQRADDEGGWQGNPSFNYPRLTEHLAASGNLKPLNAIYTLPIQSGSDISRSIENVSLYAEISGQAHFLLKSLGYDVSGTEAVHSDVQMHVCREQDWTVTLEELRERHDRLGHVLPQNQSMELKCRITFFEQFFAQTPRSQRNDLVKRARSLKGVVLVFDEASLRETEKITDPEEEMATVLLFGTKLPLSTVEAIIPLGPADERRLLDMIR